MNKDFAVFILTHGRPDNVITLDTLKRCGYTGKVFLVIDNEDKQADDYFKRYGRKMVIQFDKKKYADECDECNNFDERRTITMARNASFDIAKQVGVKYFMQLDDDYTKFEYRFADKQNTKLLVRQVNNLDAVFNFHLEFYKKTPFKSIAFAQGGDFIGGVNGDYLLAKRKCMNSFLCSTDRPFKFVGAMNEDVNTYTTLGSRGHLFLTVPLVSLSQKPTQQQSGGITDMYLKYGTYCKSFTTVMNMPSSVKVVMMNTNNPRLHHIIKWNNTVPKIVSEEVRK
jgi:hypothetical protein